MTSKPISTVIRDMREHADYIIALRDDAPGSDELIHAYDTADTLFGAENVKRLIDHITSLEQQLELEREKSRCVMSQNYRLNSVINTEANRADRAEQRLAELSKQLDQFLATEKKLRLECSETLAQSLSGVIAASAAELVLGAKFPKDLRDIGNNLRTQNNRATDQPMFVVFEKQEIIGSDEHSPSRIVWCRDGKEVSESKAKRLEALYQDCRPTDGYDRYAMQEIDVFVTTCFTEQGCKDFLRRDGHNHRLPYIYACGSYRNHEYHAVRNFLAGLPVEGE